MYSHKELKYQLKQEMGALQKFYPFLSEDVNSVQKQWIYVGWLKNTKVKRQPSGNFKQRCDLSLILYHHYQSHRWWNNIIIHTFLYIVPLPSCSQALGLSSSTSWQIQSSWCPGMVRHVCLHSLICVWAWFLPLH